MLYNNWCMNGPAIEKRMYTKIVNQLINITKTLSEKNTFEIILS